MTENPDDWPPEQYRLAPNNYLAALGQMTFVYNMLESMMRNVFEKASPLEEEFAKNLFHNLNNRDRCDLLTAFVNKNESDPTVLDALLHCIRCYDICTDNRNILMHSIYFNPNPKTTILVKRAANDPLREIHFDVPLADLRRTADEATETFRYALNIFSFLGRRKFLAELPLASELRTGPLSQNPLPDKPPKPRKLTPYRPAVAHKDAQPPP